MHVTDFPTAPKDTAVFYLLRCSFVVQVRLMAHNREIAHMTVVLSDSYGVQADLYISLCANSVKCSWWLSSEVFPNQRHACNVVWDLIQLFTDGDFKVFIFLVIFVPIGSPQSRGRVLTICLFHFKVSWINEIAA